MTVDPGALRKLLCERLCEDVRVDAADALPVSRRGRLSDLPLRGAGYRIEGRDDVPVFLYGVPDREARLTTVMLSHFHRYALPFASILVFENRAEIPRLDLARLSNVGGETVASLEAGEDLDRKLRMRMAA